MSDDQFTKLFKYMQQRFDEIDKRFDEVATKDSVDRLTNTIDGLLKRLDEETLERRAMQAQFDRLLEWARKVSDKTGIPLENL